MKLDPTVVSGCDSSAFQEDCCPRISCVALCGCVCVCEELCGACRYCALSVNRAAEVHGWRRLLRLCTSDIQWTLQTDSPSNEKSLYQQKHLVLHQHQSL